MTSLDNPHMPGGNRTPVSIGAFFKGER